MNDIFNFQNSWIIVEQNWWLMLLALALGIWVGWKTADPDQQAT